MHHIDLDTITLTKGSHEDRDAGVCLLEAVAWWAEEPHSDKPACVSPILGGYGRSLNDVLPYTKRQALKPLIPLLPGTSRDGLDETRGYLALDWLIRTYTPAWLDLAGLAEEAQTLRDLRRIVDLVAATEAGLFVRNASDKAAAAWVAAGAAAWAADWAAARVAARDTAWAATRDAAGAAVWAAAWVADWDTAWGAARDATRVAAGAAAWAAARDATRDAAGAAAWAAADKKLAPTVAQLQDSAIALFGQMINPALVRHHDGP